ncbi:MAG: helix-hairpin-helix domain-containing protein, partial [Chloroflexota bacterium]
FKRAKDAVARFPGAAPSGDELEGTEDDPSDPLKQDAEAKWGTLPDLVIIDGGRGHLNAVTEVLRELGVHFIPVCSLAKQQEEVFLPHVSESVMLPKASQGLYLLQRIRDEAHRFAITYHRQLRSKASVGSALDDVPGIGPRRRKALLQRFGSVRALKETPVEELAAAPGMTIKLAQKLLEAI